MKLNLYLFQFILASFWHVHGQALPVFSITVCKPQSTGYYFLTPVKINLRNFSPSVPFHIILDNKGRVLYHKKQPIGAKEFTCDFKLHSNGLMSYYFRDKFYLMNGSFKIIDSIYCKNGLRPDNHELQILPDGHFLLLGTEEVEMDLSGYKMFNKNKSPGSKKARVVCGVIQEQDASKKVVFEWHSKNYFAFNDVDTFYLSNPDEVNWTHLNAIEYDKDGYFLISSKNFNEITKIRRADSSIVWRLGGNRNQFVFNNDNLKFRAQHDIRKLTNGNLTLFDNGKEGIHFHPAAAKEYDLDEKNLTAQLVWSHVEKAGGNSPLGLGNAQRLVNGNTLVNYGIYPKSNILFNVVTHSGENIFEIAFKDSLRSYRAFNYKDLPLGLVRPEVKCRKENNKIYLEAGDGYSKYKWSTGDSTRTIHVKKPGNYFVFVPIGDGGFISSLYHEINDLSHICASPGLNSRTKKTKRQRNN